MNPNAGSAELSRWFPLSESTAPDQAIIWRAVLRNQSPTCRAKAEVAAPTPLSIAASGCEASDTATTATPARAG